ncbi:hypothetical protein PspLS_04525 [Pyricularia sp. CBS 133598]|nr:hypothetical protein PspLS_04525 [Pyricularia sp. CBS 133598]
MVAFFSPRRVGKRLILVLAVALTGTFFLSQILITFSSSTPSSVEETSWTSGWFRQDWARRKEKFPVNRSLMVRPPSGSPRSLPRVQHKFAAPDAEFRKLQATRQAAVKQAFEKSWGSYRQYAWGYDELRPVTLEGHNSFAGWGATLVDSLDSLWIMGMKDDFAEAVKAVKKINWSKSSGPMCSLFETNIRYLGGLLSAYDLSQEKVLLDKAVELAHMLYAAFDNQFRLPVNAFFFTDAWNGDLQLSYREVAAAVGSMSLEFTRVAQLTGEPKFYDAIDRIKVHLSNSQNETRVPGLWPMSFDLHDGFDAQDTIFTLGAQADSLYEYLPKMYALLGGRDQTYATMHKTAMDAAEKHILFRPMIPDKDVDILFPGNLRAYVSAGDLQMTPEIQHLGCFTGGMYALGGRLLNNDSHVELGKQLARGCAWAYKATVSGIMPEVASMVACEEPKLAKCKWNKSIFEAKGGKYRTEGMPPAFASITDYRYILRPEAIESVFVLYRITGDREWLDWAWAMFESIKKATETEKAFSAIANVLGPDGRANKANGMESFWLAETLKYFYLIFSDPDLISLDDYVLNTEAHPLKIPKPM